MAAFLKMEGISKSFSGVFANENIDLEVRKGEIHSLLGENGAGKTTLMNILYGMYKKDQGLISLRGQNLSISSPHDAINHGIGMVHQHFMLIPVFSVTENIILGMRLPGEPLLLKKRVEKEILHISKQYGLEVDPGAIVADLAVGVRQRVEIIKALYRNADLLILDEPTAVLTPGEVKDLLIILRNLADQGRSVIFISHKLDEVMEISDRITVLRDGKKVKTVNRDQTDKMRLARMMVGREVVLRTEKDNSCQSDARVLEVKELTTNHGGRKSDLKDVSFHVGKGEIFGVAGVDGNGQQALASVLSGLDKPTSGEALIEGKSVVNMGARRLIRSGVARIPEDRHHLGLVLDFTVEENMVIDSCHQQPLSRFGIINFKEMRKQAQHLCEKYDVRPCRPEATACDLSGGNQQKIILARELNREPSFILAVQPTRGLDIGATEFVYRCLLEQRKKGVGILLISTELDEIINLADRIAVLYEGKIMGITETNGCDPDISQIGLMMAGTVSQMNQRSEPNFSRETTDRTVVERGRQKGQ